MRIGSADCWAEEQTDLLKNKQTSIWNKNSNDLFVLRLVLTFKLELVNVVEIAYHNSNSVKLDKNGHASSVTERIKMSCCFRVADGIEQ
jgi:inorganic pyrophosphatase/exopolyphosphatase